MCFCFIYAFGKFGVRRLELWVRIRSGFWENFLPYRNGIDKENQTSKTQSRRRGKWFPSAIFKLNKLLSNIFSFTYTKVVNRFCSLNDNFNVKMHESQFDCSLVWFLVLFFLLLFSARSVSLKPSFLIREIIYQMMIQARMAL